MNGTMMLWPLSILRLIVAAMSLDLGNLRWKKILTTLGIPQRTPSPSTSTKSAVGGLICALFTLADFEVELETELAAAKKAKQAAIDEAFSGTKARDNAWGLSGQDDEAATSIAW